MPQQGDTTTKRKRSQHRATDLRRATAMSRVTNGKQILPGIDNRTPVARRYRDIVSIVAADQGGIERLSEARKQLIRRFSGLCVLAEDSEARILNGESIDITTLCHLTSTLVRVVQRLGINRVAREVTPLSEYLKSNVASPRDAP